MEENFYRNNLSKIAHKSNYYYRLFEILFDLHEPYLGKI